MRKIIDMDMTLESVKVFRNEAIRMEAIAKDMDSTVPDLVALAVYNLAKERCHSDVFKKCYGKKGG